MTARDLLEPDALRAFAVFAEHRNFTAAAARLHLSQPSLHTKIAKLAAALGVRLYERDGRALVLTAEGRRLAAYAQDERRRVDDFLAALQAGEHAVTIAAGRGALRWVVPDAIRRISAHHRIRLLVLDREAALAALATGEADVAVIASDPPPRTLRSTELAAYAQVLVLPQSHRLARRRRVHLRDLGGLDLVVPPADRPHRRTLDRALHEAGVTWQPVAEADGWDLLVHLASLGLGAAVVNGCVAVPDGLVAVPVADLPKVRYWAAWRAQREQPAEVFRAALTP